MSYRLIYIFFFIYLLCLIGIFQYTPFDFIANFFISIVSGIAIILNIVKKNKNKYKSKYIFWSNTICIFLLVLSILNSKYIYQQPIVSGVLACTSFIYFFSPFTFSKLIKGNHKHISLYSPLFKKMWKGFIMIGWMQALYLAIFSILSLHYTYFSPFSGAALTVDGSRVSRGIVYFLAIYYLIHGIINNNRVNVIYSIFLIGIGQLYDFQRWDIVCFLTIFLIVFIKFRKKRSVQNIAIVSPLVLLGLIIFLSSSNSLREQIEGKYEQAFKLFETNDVNKIQDASVFIRIYETEYAMKQFKEHPIAGNGLLRASFQSQILPDFYFYPEDIGLIGILYVFGIIGIIVFVVVGFWILWLYKKIDWREPFQVTCLFYLIFLYIFSFKTGGIILDPAKFSLFSIIIYYRIRGNELKKYNNGYDNKE